MSENWSTGGGGGGECCLVYRCCEQKYYQKKNNKTELTQMGGEKEGRKGIVISFLMTSRYNWLNKVGLLSKEELRLLKIY